MNNDKALPRTTTSDALIAQVIEAFEPERKETRQLSKRERSVIRLLAQGLSPSEVADQLGLSVNTISTYIQRMHGKVGTTSTIQLAVLWARAEERGLCS